MSESILFSSYLLGEKELKNRVVMSPMTRCRSVSNIPGQLVATYYGQRSEAGLIITEGVSPSPNGLGYARIPGLFNDAQVEGWQKTTAAVHDKGGVIFAQLMHSGRVGHPLNLPPGARLLSPSAIAAPTAMYTDTEGMKPCPVPPAMSENDIEITVAEYVHAAKNAIHAGFDGVELHGANGYLIEQFLNLASNQRDDRWGRTVEGRARFALHVAMRTVSALGADKVGIRLSPAGGANGMKADSDTPALYTLLAEALSDLGVAYIHLVDHSSMGSPKPAPALVGAIRDHFNGTIILSGGYDLHRAERDLSEGNAELIAFGRPFIANPDLVSKLKRGATLREPNPETFYTPDEKGYTDYPTD